MWSVVLRMAMEGHAAVVVGWPQKRPRPGDGQPRRESIAVARQETG
jgi:hypothetical protein